MDPTIKELNDISKDDLILDIGPKTIKTINNLIDKSNTIFGMDLQVILKTLILLKEVFRLQKKLLKKIIIIQFILLQVEVILFHY